MNTMFGIPDDPKKIRARIRRYERKFAKEQQLLGRIGDGSGCRYFLGPLYMAMDDQDGALKSFSWYERTFPDDDGDPAQLLCWALCLKRAGQADRAREKLREAMLSNLYLIPLLLGERLERLDMEHSSNIAWPEWAEMTPDRFLALWTEEERRWAGRIYQGTELSELRRKWIDVHRRLDGLRCGPERTRLCREAWSLRFPGEPYPIEVPPADAEQA